MHRNAIIKKNVSIMKGFSRFYFPKKKVDKYDEYMFIYCRYTYKKLWMKNKMEKAVKMFIVSYREDKCRFKCQSIAMCRNEFLMCICK